MKKKSILILCAALIFAGGVTALCSGAVQGVASEAAAELTEAEIEELPDTEEEIVVSVEVEFNSEPETDLYEEVGTDTPEEVEAFTETATEEPVSESATAEETTEMPTEVDSTEPTDAESGAKYTYSYVFSGSEGENINMLVHGKNLTDAEKYVFEIDYSAYADSIEILDLCALTWEKETEAGISENGQVEIISIDNGKITFKVSNIGRGEGETWSGLLNIMKFTKLTEDDVTIALNVYE